MARAFACLFSCAALVAIYYIFADAITTITPVLETERTARHLASQQTAQAWAQTYQAWGAQLGDTVRTWAWPAAIGAILIVAAVQTGRTLRHRETEVTRRRALLALYMARMLPGANAQISTYQGQLAVINHDDGEIIPWEVAQIEMSAARLLTDQYTR